MGSSLSKTTDYEKQKQASYDRAFSLALEKKRKKEQQGDDGGADPKDLDHQEDEIVQKQMKHRKHEFQRVTRYFETNLLMHRLTVTHYNARAKYCTYYPILGITMIVSIAAFVATHFSAEGSDDTAISLEEIEAIFIKSTSNSSGNIDGEQRYLEDAVDGVSYGMFSLQRERHISFVAALVAGVCGVISTILASAGKYNNYQSKADMHTSAVNTLKGICDTLKINEILLDRTKGNKDFVRLKKIRQERINNNQTPLDDDHGIYGGIKLINSNVEGCDIEAHKIAFKTMKESCTHPIPTRIETAFRDLYWEFRAAPLEVRKYIYPKLYHALRHEIANHWLFPIFLPNIDIQQFFMKEIGEKYDKYLEKTAKDDENTTLRENANLREENANLKKDLEAAKAETKSTVANTEEEGSKTSTSLDEEDAKKTALTDTSEDLESGN